MAFCANKPKIDCMCGIVLKLQKAILNFNTTDQKGPSEEPISS